MRKHDPLNEYHKVAETVGFIPSFRGKDNLFQGLAVLVGILLGATLGLLLTPASWGVPRWFGAVLGAIGGLVVFGVGSGFVLMVLGWVRLFRKDPPVPTSCPKCGYDLAGLSANACPECGRDFR